MTTDHVQPIDAFARPAPTSEKVVRRCPSKLALAEHSSGSAGRHQRCDAPLGAGAVRQPSSTRHERNVIAINGRSAGVEVTPHRLVAIRPYLPPRIDWPPTSGTGRSTSAVVVRPGERASDDAHVVTGVPDGHPTDRSVVAPRRQPDAVHELRRDVRPLLITEKAVEISPGVRVLRRRDRQVMHRLDPPPFLLREAEQRHGSCNRLIPALKSRRSPAHTEWCGKFVGNGHREGDPRRSAPEVQPRDSHAWHGAGTWPVGADATVSP